MSRLTSAFVTGAAGFIGRHLVRQLLAEDVQVVALVMPGEPTPAEWQSRVRTVVGDVRNLLAIGDQVGPVDAVFHLAAIVSDWGARQEHIDVTVRGTEQAIELALAWGAHFVVTSSICAYGSTLGTGRLDEDSPLGEPSSPYEFCKQEQERVTREGVARGLKATIVRPANVFGIGSGPWVDTLGDMMRQGKPCLLGSGDWDAGLVHVENLVALLIAAARSDCIRGDVFVAADGFGVTWRTYTARLAHVMGTPPPRSVPNLLGRALAPVLEWVAHARGQKERPLITRQSFRLMGVPNEFSVDKARRLLGYEPARTFEQAMRALAEHYGSAGAAHPTTAGARDDGA
jgi:nucleoside-diphosphate-sugar epimerase